jgi:dipeptidyl aminopeptidase/acylaminoacyl peptidase
VTRDPLIPRGGGIDRRALLSGLVASPLMRGSERLTFISLGRSVSMDVVRPDRSAPGPAVLLLHGRGGLSLYGADFRSRAARLARRGFVVFTLHYFEVTASADAPEVSAQLFESWRQALTDALERVRGLPYVDRRRIALLGVSLGGFIATVEAADGAGQLAAVVAESAGLSDYFPRRPRRLPPLLLVCSAHDPIVPLDNVRALAAAARGLGGEADLVVLPGEQHLLDGAAAARALDIETAFLLKALA